MRFPSNSYFCPFKCLYITAGPGLHPLDVWPVLFGVNVEKNGKFWPERWFCAARNLLPFLSNSHFCPSKCLHFIAGCSLHLLDVLLALFARLVAKNGKICHVDALDYFTPLTPPPTPLRVPSNSYFCPPKCPYLRAGFPKIATVTFGGNGTRVLTFGLTQVYFPHPSPIARINLI